jgi:hypothetical protein
MVKTGTAERGERKKRTLDEARQKHPTRRQDHRALPSNADGSADVVARDHPRRDVSLTERRNRGRSAGLELVFEDDKTEEAKVGLDGVTGGEKSGQRKGTK